MDPVPRSDMKMNTIRLGIVVLGALAFGYLRIQIGFKYVFPIFLVRVLAHKPIKATTTFNTNFIVTDRPSVPISNHLNLTLITSLKSH
ncbi:hypothetical protein SESBI_29085 [Sesbania bispinosa]|nr:hypothetical protein SESBI_29085 [Sesbania bispinosa]